jgi:FixJ family two-component response regulator
MDATVMTLPTPEPRGEPLTLEEVALLSRLVAEHTDKVIAAAAGVAPATAVRGARGLGLYRRQREALSAFLRAYDRAA